MSGQMEVNVQKPARIAEKGIGGYVTCLGRAGGYSLPFRNFPQLEISPNHVESYVILSRNPIPRYLTALNREPPSCFSAYRPFSSYQIREAVPLFLTAEEMPFADLQLNDGNKVSLSFIHTGH